MCGYIDIVVSILLLLSIMHIHLVLLTLMLRINYCIYLYSQSTTSFLGKDTVSMPSLDIQESDSVPDSHVHDEDLGSDLPLSHPSKHTQPVSYTHLTLPTNREV